ncbi:homeobox-leucine zipper protein HAT22-like isoform X2 [Cynara cardunculus var. scolymus]|uniref:homeobox-leucine zipper protein HAT22-like isoform X2 n=1 Tax=Cynara cardunculus var. scolymus TaxID=59895 RepID=UPI000D62DB82|nr:homeobox-leucine zipper protein HAT22-like isoform X2 [Cynara cardunculus var. scolymus]
MGFHGVSNKGLILELGLNSTSSSSSILENNSTTTKKPCSTLSFQPSLTLSLSGDHATKTPPPCVAGVGGNTGGEHGGGLYRQDSVSGGGSSFSVASVSVKREREVKSEDSEKASRVISRTSVDDHEVEEDDDDGSVNGRKKLRLTKAQSALLEEAFKHHSTLNPKQKQELARELKLRPRQVEVWFQNRRARTKLKQTEVDCEYLKKCCEALKEENSRLHKELQELKALKLSAHQSLYMQLPAATLTMCPSCERIGDTTSSAKSRPFNMAPKSHLFNPFSNPSAAC